jgi:HAD superfamily hydrolase (TIGR01509 family)
MKIKAIILDIGDVILLENDKEVFPKLVNKFGIHKENFLEVRRRYVDKALVLKRNTFWYEKKIARGLKINAKNFIKYWQELREKYFDFNQEAKNILTSLKKQGYFLVDLTNVIYSHELIRNKRGVYDSFDLNFKSREMGMKKPSEKMFKKVLKKINFSPPQILFIDDKESNTELAKKLGMNVIQFIDYNQLKEDLKSFGVEV